MNHKLKIALFVVSLLLFPGCRFIADALDPDRSKYVSPTVVEEQIKKERQ